MPVLPLAMIYAGYAMFTLYSKCAILSRTKAALMKTLIACTLFINIPVAVYLSVFHQAGPISVMYSLQVRAAVKREKKKFKTLF